MSHWLLTHELAVRLTCFIGVIVAMALWEWLAPRRAWHVGRRPRWSNHFLLTVLNTSLLRIIAPAGAVGIAIWADIANLGLLNYYEIPYVAAVMISVVALDFVIYLQHAMFHAIPLFWRIHRMHHADLDFDFTTGVRFHPAEILLSLGIKAGVIIFLGTPALAVLIFEVLLNATSVFNHGNVRLPASVDRWLRWLVVTPEMHRVHHSVHPHETNSNFGFNLPWWDRLFGTYKPQPDDGHEAMTIGLAEWRNTEEIDRISALLTFPWRGSLGGYTVSRRAPDQDRH